MVFSEMLVTLFRQAPETINVVLIYMCGWGTFDQALRAGAVYLLFSLVVGCWDLEILLSHYLLLSLAWVLAISPLLTIHRLLAILFCSLYLLLFLVVGC